jgi:hypothetical protein
MKSAVSRPAIVRVPIGEASGFWQQLNGMHHWLHQRIGLDRFQQHRVRDDVTFTFDDASVAREFAARFAAQETEAA